MCVFVYVCGPDKLCWVMNLLPLTVSTNPLSDRHTHTHTHACTHTWQDKQLLVVYFALVIHYMLTLLERLVKRQIDSEKGRREKQDREGEKLNTKCWGQRERERVRNLVGWSNEEEGWKRKAGQERMVWAYLTGQTLARSFCRLTEDRRCTDEGGIVTSQRTQPAVEFK